MGQNDQLAKFKFGKYAGFAIGFQWRRMDEGRVLWWYKTKKNGELGEPTRAIPADVEEMARQYNKLGGFAGMTLVEFIVDSFNGNGTYD